MPLAVIVMAAVGVTFNDIHDVIVLQIWVVVKIMVPFEIP